MVRAVHVPGQTALELDLHLAHDDHRDALVQAQTGDRTLVGVAVLLLREAPHTGDHVVAEDLGLPQRVLGVRRAPGVLVAVLAADHVRNLGVVARGPDVVGALHLEGGGGVDVAARAQRQAVAGQRRVGLDAGGPHDGVGVDLKAVVQLDVAVDAGVHAGLEVDLDAAALKVLLAVGTELGADLGEDLVGDVDQQEAHVFALDVLVVLGGVAGHVLDLADGLRTREATADEDEGQRLAADILVGRRVGLVQLLQNVVAQADGLLHALHTDAVLGQAGDREGARDRTQRDDQVVEGQLVRLTDQRGDGGDLAVLIDGGDPAGEDLRLGQDAPQRDDDVPGGDAAGGGFGEEGLVGHVRPRVDDRDGRLAVAHLLENAPSCVQAYVPTAYYEDPGTLRGAHAIEYPPPHGGSLVSPFTRPSGVSATLRRLRDRRHSAKREPRCIARH